MKDELDSELSEEIFCAILLQGEFCLSLLKYLEYKKNATILKSLGYLETPYKNTDIFLPTELGKLVLQAGGWKDYTKAKNQEKEKYDKKEYYELQNIKFKYYSFWPMLVLSLIGGTYSIIQITKSLQEENKSKMEQTNSNISSEGSKKSTGLPLKIHYTVSYNRTTK